jgi:hypothetical protein
LADADDDPIHPIDFKLAGDCRLALERMGNGPHSGDGQGLALHFVGPTFAVLDTRDAEFALGLA